MLFSGGWRYGIAHRVDVRVDEGRGKIQRGAHEPVGVGLACLVRVGFDPARSLNDLQQDLKRSGVRRARHSNLRAGVLIEANAALVRVFLQPAEEARRFDAISGFSGWPRMHAHGGSQLLGGACRYDKAQGVSELVAIDGHYRELRDVGLCLDARLLVLDTASQARADEVVTLLVEALPGLSVALRGKKKLTQAF